MKYQKTYEVGEQVMIKVKVTGMSFDDHGRIKYRLKDEKSGSLLRWEYTEEDIIPCPTTKSPRKKTAEKKPAASKSKVPAKRGSGKE